MDQNSLDVKIINLELAQRIDENEGMSSKKVGNNFYLPPEIVKRENYSLEKAEVWELGVVLFNLLFEGELPFRNNREILRKNVLRRIESGSIRYSRFWNGKDQNFLALMMSKLPDSRPSFGEILRHFFPSDDFSKKPANSSI